MGSASDSCADVSCVFRFGPHFVNCSGSRQSRPRCSDTLDVDPVGVGREGFEIIGVASEDGPVGLGERYDKCIDCGASAGSAAKLRSPPSQRFGDLVLEDAGLQEAVRVGITPRAAL